ncbi:MAG: hypothetical protein HC802_17780 [Caldilineaceae bacterium]|nr:hypothetical protein [Caldilineaceae bacterium]
MRLRRSALTVVILFTLLLPRAAPTLLAQSVRPPGAATPIYGIQGSGTESPLQGEWRDSFGRVTGVTGDGFYLQDPFGDGEPTTSDGLFVYTYNPPTVQVGQCVYVTRGLVSEFYGKTELSRIKSVEPVDACGGGQIEPAEIPLPRFRQDPSELFEPYEGMLVQVKALAGVVQGPTKRFRDGEIELGLVADPNVPYLYGERVFQSQDGYTTALVYLDNAVGATLPDANWGDRVVANPSGDGSGRLGDLTAILDYNFGKYQLVVLPGQHVVGEAQPRQPERTIPAALDEFTVCTFNLFGMGRGSAQFPADADYLPELTRRVR